MSSAQMNFVNAVCGSSLTYTLNRLGERTEPSGKPFFWCRVSGTFCQCELVSVCLNRVDSIVEGVWKVLLECPSAKLCRRAYAAAKSRKMTPVFCLRWNPFSMNVMRARTWSQVPRPCLKPACSTTIVSSRVGLIRCRKSRSMALKRMGSNGIGR